MQAQEDCLWVWYLAAAELWGRESDRTFSASETSRAGRPASPNAARREVYSNKEKRIDLRDFSRPIPPIYLSIYLYLSFSPEDFFDPSSEENDKTSFLLTWGRATTCRSIPRGVAALVGK